MKTLTLTIAHAPKKELSSILLELENMMEDMKETGVVKKADWWFKIK